jgi:hypothetical protein
VIQVMKQMNVPLPKIMENTEEILINKDIIKEINKDDCDPVRLDSFIRKALEWKFSVDKLTLGFITGKKIDSIIREWAKEPQDSGLLEKAEALLKTVAPLDLRLEIGRSQNIYFAVGKKLYSQMKERAARGDGMAHGWVSHFDRFGEYLKVKIG